jgi:hypothetical protein
MPCMDARNVRPIDRKAGARGSAGEDVAPLRVDSDVVVVVSAQGRGYQSRANHAIACLYGCTSPKSKTCRLTRRSTGRGRRSGSLRAFRRAGYLTRYAARASPTAGTGQ